MNGDKPLANCLRETVRRARLVAEFYPSVEACEGDVDACEMAWNVLAASLAEADRLLAAAPEEPAPESPAFFGES